MMFRFLYRRPLIEFLIIIIMVLFAQAPSQTVWYVDFESAGERDGTSWESAFREIQPAIDAAFAAGASESNPAEVWVAEGEYSLDLSEPFNTITVEMKEYIDLYGGFAGDESDRTQRDWENNLTHIFGHGHYRALSGADNCLLDGFVILAGSGAQGGGMTNNNVSPVVRNCAFELNDSMGSEYLGVVYNHQSLAVFENCRFTGNEGGYGGAILNINSDTEITDCVFDSTQAVKGGAIYNLDSSPLISNCLFNEVIAFEDGGAIYNENSTPTIHSCTFTKNTASLNGGALCNDNSQPIILDCTFSNNSSMTGGAIYNDHSSFTINRNRFIENVADRGGAIYNIENEISITNCLFKNNTAHENGAIMCHISDLSITNCLFDGDSFRCNAGGIGGAAVNGVMTNTIYLYSSDRVMEDMVVSYCCMTEGYEGVGNITENPLFWDPINGDYRLHAESPCLDQGTNIGIPVEDIRGMSRPQGPGIDIGLYEMIEIDSDEDGLYDDFETEYSNTNPNLWDSDQDGLSDGDEWFGVGNWFVNSSSKASSSDGNSWETAFPDIQTAIDHGYMRGGGEVWVAQGEYVSETSPVVQLKRDVFLYGGFEGDETELDERDWEQFPSIIDGENQHCCVYGENRSLLDGFTVQNGYSERYGAGMFNKCVTTRVQNCLFRDNTAETHGGGVYSSRSSVSFNDCHFLSNLSEASGGGICNDYSTVTLEGCRFEENNSSGFGAAIYNNMTDLTVSSCYMANNMALTGGGIYNDGSWETNNEDNPITTIDRCFFKDNSCVSSDETTSFKVNAIYNNSGMIYLENSICHKITSNDDNTEIYSYKGSLQVTNCTLVNHSLGYGDFFAVDSGARIKNSILWGYEIVLDDQYAEITRNCIQYGYEGLGNFSALPLFWDPLNGDFRLHSTSPCLDQGIDFDVPDHDYRGVTRPQGDGIDIGAFEMDELDTDADDLFDNFETEYSGTTPGDWDSDDNGVSDGDQWFNPSPLFVNSNSKVNSPDGESWDTAFPDIQQAINTSYLHAGGDIWVAQGTYTSGGESVIKLFPDIHLYGGFSGSETDLEQRILHRHPTIINGEGTRRSVYSDCTASLDGFTMINGYGLDGGGIYTKYAHSILSNCIVRDNEATRNGGGVYGLESTIVFTNCLLYDNSAISGACLYDVRSQTILTNCTLTQNNSLTGGVLYVVPRQGVVPELMNCIVWGNSDSFSGRPNVTYSCIQNPYNGDGIINQDPQFIKPDDGNFMLRATSPCLDTGLLEGAPQSDIRGTIRPQGNGIDMGAYERIVDGVIFFSN